jgi:YHS domain-containing protein
MRNLAILCGAAILSACLSMPASAQGVPWVSNLESAKQAAAASNRLVLIHFSAHWCYWCKPLEKNVFAQPEVARAIETHYVPVLLDYDKHRQIARQYNIGSIPWDVVITPDGSWVKDFRSPQSPTEYVACVNEIAGREMAKRNVRYAQEQMLAQPQPPAQPVQAGPSDMYARPQEQNQQRPVDDRYAEYFKNRQPETRVDPVSPPLAAMGVPPSGMASPPAQPSPPATSMPGYGSYQPSPGYDLAAAPQAAPGFGGNPAPAQAPVFNAPSMPGFTPPAQSPPQFEMQQSPAPAASLGQPTFALDSHCPVHLVEQNSWTAGDRRWGARHRGKTYLFVSEGCQKKFLANPDRYAPALAGNDPVALVDRGQTVAGRREYGCYFGVEPNRRVVLFADEASYQTFSRNPQRYAGQILATQ